jgi:cytoskeletal protein RodZ
MNHRNTSLAIVAIVAAVAITGVAFAVPQQVLAYRHHHNSNSIKVDQQISQANVCSTPPPESEETNETMTQEHAETEEAASSPTICLNNANNTADIHG